MKTMPQTQALFLASLALLELVTPIYAHPSSGAEPAKPVTTASEVSLEKIMGHPSWIGQWPEQVRFVPGGNTLMYSRKKNPRGTEVVEISRQGKTVEVFNTSGLPSESSRWNDKTVFSWQGDLFTASPERLRLTRTVETESSPRWIDNDLLIYRSDAGLGLRDLKNGSLRQVAQIVSEDDPSAKKRGFVEEQHDRLFPLLQEREQLRHEQKRAHGIPRLAIGAQQEMLRAEVTPDLTFLLVAHAESGKAKTDKMPNYVTRDGYLELPELRAKVGEAKTPHHSLTLFRLADGSSRSISYEGLPRWSAERAVRLEKAEWSRTGRLALMLLSQDFEDRWLVEVDFGSARLKLIEHLHDPAWHAWDLNEFGWSRDGKTFWYQSEKTGYAHLYLWDSTSSRPLTQGNYEVSSIKLTDDRRYFYFRANKERATQYDIFRVDRNGKLEQITRLGGNTGYDLSSNGQEIAFLHSRIDHPPEVYLQKAAPGATPTQLTETTTAEFQAIDWTVPTVIAVPSSHQARPIAAKLYPAQGAKPGGPAVVFVHGAGYLQNADEAWSVYFREFMFHTLLNRLGVTVLDMDYRASAGYGRDWRTAIYRKMGTPELQDLQDGVAYLIKEHGVAPDRVGIYGGSYGGFMTLMAMFKTPDLFACGAALRPVTDWAQYHHEYTARILNTPKEDPEAYLRSSPIEFAEGLKNPLLMCHGLIDDNVVAQDTIRLAQRLIQLEKENWEMALYPVEPHGFVEPSSWLDEYRRILKLFRQHLKLDSSEAIPGREALPPGR